jgi:hypothetical protein
MLRSVWNTLRRRTARSVSSINYQWTLKVLVVLQSVEVPGRPVYSQLIPTHPDLNSAYIIFSLSSAETSSPRLTALGGIRFYCC